MELQAENQSHDANPQYFHYHPLQDGEFRIVVVKTGAPDEPLSAELWLTDVDHTSKGILYNAVSYSWSHDKADKEISINGWPTKISSGLYELLKFNRDQERERNPNPNSGVPFWIDQICINQADEKDKAQQVPYMRRIYETANSIMVWLGPAADDSDLAIDLVRRISTTYWKTGIPADSEILNLEDPELMRSWKALAALLRRPYWNRTWIIQECTANMKNELVLCGSKTCSLAAILDICTDVKKLVGSGKAPQFIAENVYSSMGVRIKNFLSYRRAENQETVDLFRLLDMARRTECTDQRDRVYSMLSFASDFIQSEEKSLLEVTYTRPTFEVYGNVVKWYLKTYGNLEFLGACVSSRSNLFDYELIMPSWIPNWTQASFMRDFRKRTVKFSRSAPPTYRACGPYSYRVEFNLEPPQQPLSILIDGFKIATIVRVLEAAGVDWPHATTERAWQDQIEPNQRYCLTDENMQDAFTRTIVADVKSVNGGDELQRNARGVLDGTNIEKIDSVKDATMHRRLFFAGGSAEDGTAQSDLLLGLGRDDIEVGDQIWALKGGSVLYILRFHSIFATGNTYEPTQVGHSHPNLLSLQEKKRPWDEIIAADNFSFVGEAYVHGLMDGEALDYAAKAPEDRPAPLRDLESKFRELFIGGIEPDNENFF